MAFLQNALANGIHNFLLIGAAGCGKSEIALNLALLAAEESQKPVHFFDMDMTKPLFRSRDVFENPVFQDIHFHFEAQFFDAPTLVGGVREHMRDSDKLLIMDVGGDEIGARSVGGFLLGPRRTDTAILYILNVYRPFCQSLERIDRILSEILAVTHVTVDDLHLIHNPNLGLDTTPEEVIAGAAEMERILDGAKEIELTAVHGDLYDRVKGKIPTELLPIQPYLTYPWLL